MKPCFAVSMTVGVALFLGMAFSPASAQTRTESVFNGHRIIIPESSIPQPGRHHTNYFFGSERPFFFFFFFLSVFTRSVSSCCELPGTAFAGLAVHGGELLHRHGQGPGGHAEVCPGSGRCGGPCSSASARPP